MPVVLPRGRDGKWRRSIIVARGMLILGLLLFGVAPVAARDPATPRALGDAPDGGEHSPDANPTRALDRFESETRPKNDEMLATASQGALSPRTPRER